MSSIRSRLLLWQISALIVTGVLVSYLAYSLAWNGFNKVRDYTLEQVAYSIVRHGVEIEAEGQSTKERRDKGQFLSQIWGRDGKLIYASRSTPELPPQAPGTTIVNWEGVEWHTFTMRKGDLVIQVANTTENRAGMFGRIAPWLLLPLAVLVAFLGGLIWIAVGRALTPLERVRKEIGTRGTASMEELTTTGLPDEVRPLVTTLN
ncbi:MAG: sensor histidine kinase N-terminal domain-containing protein, partial [Sulfuritalea sp.]|nr:sensor histidine kinase N-terminal domain-containing protein [Sulfuritalea sp.]